MATPSFAEKPIVSNVSAYSDGAPVVSQRYFIEPEKGQVQANSFEFSEYAGHVERALSTKGMIRVPDENDADVFVLVGYGISQPNISSGIYSTPHYVQAGISNPSATGQVTRYGVVTGYDVNTYDITTYDRYLRIAALDAAAARANLPIKERWHVDVKSEGTYDDLRQIVPAMAYSASAYIGVDTGKAVAVRVKSKSKDYISFLQRPIHP